MENLVHEVGLPRFREACDVLEKKLLERLALYGITGTLDSRQRMPKTFEHEIAAEVEAFIATPDRNSFEIICESRGHILTGDQFSFPLKDLSTFKILPWFRQVTRGSEAIHFDGIDISCDGGWDQLEVIAPPKNHVIELVKALAMGFDRLPGNMIPLLVDPRPLEIGPTDWYGGAI